MHDARERSLITRAAVERWSQHNTDAENDTSCGKEMKVISALTSPHQDDIIERILKSRGAWDPPWKRQRRARGPPKELELVADASEIASQDDDEFEFNQDPPSEWWND